MLKHFYMNIWCLRAESQSASPQSSAAAVTSSSTERKFGWIGKMNGIRVNEAQVHVCKMLGWHVGASSWALWLRKTNHPFRHLCPGVVRFNFHVKFRHCSELSHAIRPAMLRLPSEILHTTVLRHVGCQFISVLGNMPHVICPWSQSHVQCNWKMPGTCKMCYESIVLESQ